VLALKYLTCMINLHLSNEQYAFADSTT
jgi:hypothetical protein